MYVYVVVFTGVFPNIASRLRDCDNNTNGVLSLSRLAISAKHLQPISVALQHQQHLRQLHLQENMCGDEGVRHLLDEHVTSLSSLTHLQLQCNKLSVASVSSMVECIESKQEKPFQVVNLSCSSSKIISKNYLL